MRRDRAALLAAACALALAASPARAQSPTALLIESGPAAGEEAPHPEALHEWWFFTVQNARPAGGCGPWQAMVSFVADREAGADELLFTAVVGERTVNVSQEFSPGSLSRSTTADGTTRLALAGSAAVGAHPRWAISARSGAARLDLTLDAGRQALWHRRAPEGWGAIEITFAMRSRARGALRIGDRVCPASGATGYAEHVWGTWSRVPMWGVDFLNAHLSGGWSVYARRTPMRGEESFYGRLGHDPDEDWPPVMIVSDGRRTFEAGHVSITMKESDAAHPDLGVLLPASYTVEGTGFPASSGMTKATLVVRDPRLATILFETTSSGVLEGWGAATLSLKGSRSRNVKGTSEIEMQRYGTRYPH
jgi:hypothetical protein